MVALASGRRGNYDASPLHVHQLQVRSVLVVLLAHDRRGAMASDCEDLGNGNFSFRWFSCFCDAVCTD
jgi:hypothetical protein